MNYSTTIEKKHKIKVKCECCGEDKFIALDEQELVGLKLWRKGLMLIQEAMPNVPARERELLMSGICGECFDEMFGGGM